jgi:hypothetical protein
VAVVAVVLVTLAVVAAAVLSTHHRMKFLELSESELVQAVPPEQLQAAELADQIPDSLQAAKRQLVQLGLLQKVAGSEIFTL